MLVLHSNRHLVARQQRASAEHQQCAWVCVYVRECVWGGVEGWGFSRDSKNNEKLCWDFKENSQSFPVVMADMGLHDQATRTHIHTPLPAKAQSMNATSFDGILQPRRRRNKSFNVE